MGKLLPFLLLILLVAASTLAKPAEGDAETKAAAAPPAEEKQGTREVAVINDSWMDYLVANSYTIGTLIVGALFVLGGVGVASYYYLYNGIVGIDVAQPGSFPTNSVYQGYPQQTYTGYATGRSLDSGSAWSTYNFAKVLDYIDLAQKTYEGFDWQNMDCQKRVLCELSQAKHNPAGETGRMITNNYLLTFADALEGIPVPRIIQSYLAEYKEAISQGKSGKKSCSEVYGQKCNFSISQLLDNLKKKKD